MFKAIGGFFKKAWTNVLAPVVKDVVIPVAKEVAKEEAEYWVKKGTDKLHEKREEFDKE